jgi:hypothetical protein
MDQVDSVGTGGQTFRQPPLPIPALTEKHQQADRDCYDQGRFPERVDQRLSVESAKKVSNRWGPPPHMTRGTKSTRSMSATQSHRLPMASGMWVNHPRR